MDDRKEREQRIDRDKVQELGLQGMQSNEAQLLYRSGELRSISARTFASGNAHVQEHKLRSEAMGEPFVPCGQCQQRLQGAVVAFEGSGEARRVAESARVDEERNAASARGYEWAYGDGPVPGEEEIHHER